MSKMTDITSVFKNSKLVFHFTMWSVLFTIVCIPTAGKLIDVFGIPLSISIFYFPFVYVVADIVTEVYGYAVARRILWYTVIAQLFAVIVFQFVIHYPSSAVFDDTAFHSVLGAAPQLVFWGTVAIFSGDIANNYLLAKMKVWMSGQWMALRFWTSSLLGQAVNTAIFYSFGLWGILPLDNLIESVIAASLVKVIVETLSLPLTVHLANKVKKIEGIDTYDYKTDFNPIKF